MVVWAEAVLPAGQNRSRAWRTGVVDARPSAAADQPGPLHSWTPVRDACWRGRRVCGMGVCASSPQGEVLSPEPPGLQELAAGNGAAAGEENGDSGAGQRKQTGGFTFSFCV